MALYDRQSQYAHARYCAERRSRKNMSKSRGGRHRTLRVGAVVDSIHSTILLAGSRILRRMGWSKGTGNDRGLVTAQFGPVIAFGGYLRYGRLATMPAMRRGKEPPS